MMTADILRALASANLVAGVTVVVILALRVPVRRMFGSRAAYALWLAVPLAALAILLPPRVITVTVSAPLPVFSSPARQAPVAGPALTAGPSAPQRPPIDRTSLILIAWAAG